MPHNTTRTPPSLICVFSLVTPLMVAAPLVVQAQTRSILQVQAVVISPEGARAWEAVASRLAPAGAPATASAAGSAAMLATIVDRTIVDARHPLDRRRVLTVDYLRN